METEIEMGERQRNRGTVAKVFREPPAAVRGSRWKMVLWLLAALIYGVSPIDLVPEAIFTTFGYGDDLVMVPLLLWRAYLTWRRVKAARAAGRSGREASEYEAQLSTP